MSKTSTKALLDYYDSIASILIKLKQIDPILCVKASSPSKYGPFDYSLYLDSKDAANVDKTFNSVIVDSYEAPTFTKFDENDVIQKLQKIVISNPESFQGLKIKNPQTAEEYKMVCDARINLVVLIRKEDDATAAYILRYFSVNE